MATDSFFTYAGPNMLLQRSLYLTLRNVDGRTLGE